MYRGVLAPQAPSRLHRHILRLQNHIKAKIVSVVAEISRVAAVIARVAAKSGSSGGKNLLFGIFNGENILFTKSAHGLVTEKITLLFFHFFF